MAFGIAFLLNFVAVSYNSLAAIPFVTMISLVGRLAADTEEVALT